MTEATGSGGSARARQTLRFPDETEPLYTVGQAAALVGVPPAFLRRLEAHDAVAPSRTPGGQRRYSRQELEHIAAISGLMEEGMTLAGAMRIVELQAEVDDLRRRLDDRPATEPADRRTADARGVRSNGRRRSSTRP